MNIHMKEKVRALSEVVLHYAFWSRGFWHSLKPHHWLCLSQSRGFSHLTETLWRMASTVHMRSRGKAFKLACPGWMDGY